MRVARWCLAPMLAASLTGCVMKGAAVSPYGRTVAIQDSTGTTRGELLAVSSDTIWLWSRGEVIPFATSAVRSVRMQRHDYGLRRGVRDMALVGLGTGLALAVACSSYEQSDDGGGDSGGCFLAVPVTALTFLLAGVLFGAIAEAEANQRIRPSEVERLRLLSRYPQGLPQQLRSVPTSRSSPADPAAVR